MSGQLFMWANGAISADCISTVEEQEFKKREREKENDQKKQTIKEDVIFLRYQ